MSVRSSRSSTRDTAAGGASALAEAPATALEGLSKSELISCVLDLQETARMKEAFSHIAESSGGDATLLWNGRSRFLAEKIVPVTLKPIQSECMLPDLDGNRIIEGDNLAVMTSLLSEFRGGPSRGFDVIYFDPPYNTGEDVFSYNDSYAFSKSEVKSLRRTNGRSTSLVSLDDPTRHTKWINHIAPRLWAAKKLLKTTGVVIISIDEHELPRLWMLMEEIFGEKNRIATLVWDRARKNDAAYISEGHEYMLVWARSKSDLDSKRSQMSKAPVWDQRGGRWRKRKDGVDEILTAYAEAKALYGDDVGQIQIALDAFFEDLPSDHPSRSIRYKKVDAKGVLNDDGNPNWPGGKGPKYDVIHPVTGKPVKVPKSGWRHQEPEMLKLIAEGRVAFKRDHKGIPRLITYLHEMENEVQTSVIKRSGQRAVEMLEAVLGKESFKNPKDPEILAELFNLVTWNDKQALILDPYAGSGTTGQAVVSMNAADGGKRRFVLVESGDPSSSPAARAKTVGGVTAERVRRYISGDWADGKPHPAFNAGFHYLRASEQITKAGIMAATRETLADIILQIVEEESNRVDCRVEGHTFLIGRTRLGYGIALVWQPAGKGSTDQMLTWDVLEAILDEAEAAKLNKPVHIYASGNTAPLSDDLYRFHQIPNSILARLGILDGDDEAQS